MPCRSESLGIRGVGAEQVFPWSSSPHTFSLSSCTPRVFRAEYAWRSRIVTRVAACCSMCCTPHPLRHAYAKEEGKGKDEGCSLFFSFLFAVFLCCCTAQTRSRVFPLIITLFPGVVSPEQIPLRITGSCRNAASTHEMLHFRNRRFDRTVYKKYFCGG